MNNSKLTRLHAVIDAVRIAGMGVMGALAIGIGAAQAQGQIAFPDLSGAHPRTGAFIGPDHPTRIRPGLNKDQVMLELGVPHFDEGLFGVSEWDYAFNFYTGKGNEYLTCQFKVKFDKADGSYRVASTHWKDPGCAQLVQGPAAAPVASGPACESCAQKTFSLQTDGLFRFDGGGEADLLSNGRERITALAQVIRTNFKSVEQVVVTGYTDRIGTDEYNDALSLVRASTVRALLVGQNMQAQQIRAVGLGKKNPVVTSCEGEAATPQLISCLQPNRRVVVEVSAAQ